MIDPSTPIEDFGLESLIMWGMRNWIFGNFRADLDPAEISDAASVSSLTSRIMDRSKFTKEYTHGSKDTGSVKKLHRCRIFLSSHYRRWRPHCKLI